MLEVVVRVFDQSAVHRIGYAVCNRPLESHFDVKFIILLKEAVRNDVEDRLFIVVPILSRKRQRNLLKLCFQQSVCGDSECTLHGTHHIRTVFLCNRPRFQLRGRTANTGISHIEHITQIGLFPVGHKQCNAGGTPSDIPAIVFVIPLVIRLAESGVGALGVDHHLFRVGELIIPGHRYQKGSPVILIRCDLPEGLFRKPGIKSLFSVHLFPPILKNPDKGSAHQKTHHPVWITY